MCEYDKNIVEYLYQTKDTESHEDSDFFYDWVRNMCKFCNNEPREIIQSIKQKPDVIEIVTAGIEGGNTLKVIGTLQSSHFVGAIPLEAEVKISYCPMCGRKLVYR